MALFNFLKASSEPLNHDKLVTETAKRLHDLMGQDGFEALLREIVKNKSVRPVDMIAMAATMGSELPTRMSKKRVAERLLLRHRSLVSINEKQQAMAARSAA